jgi:methylglutaconyl-CoA hydratase
VQIDQIAGRYAPESGGQPPRRCGVSDEPLGVDRDDRGVVTVTIDRPEVNAFDAELIRRLRETFDQLAADDAVRVVVITGAGRIFSAGADLDWMRSVIDYSFEDNVADARTLHDMLAAIRTLPQPVVARVNGHALGGGVGLVAAADIVVAVREALLGFTEVRLGIAPAVISPFVLGKIGTGHARRLFLTGERFDAEEAHRIGLVDHVTEEEDLDDVVAKVVGRLLRGGPAGQREVKSLLPLFAAARSLDDAAEHTTDAIARLRASGEGQEGMRAFLEKRRPGWHVE